MKLGLTLGLALQLSLSLNVGAQELPASSTCPSGSTSGDPTQKGQYCQAAKTAQAGSTGHDMSGHVWAAVSAVCMVSCMTPSAAGKSKLSTPCGQASLAGGLSDAVTSKSITAMMGPAKDVLNPAAAPSPSVDGAPAEKKTDSSACTAALTAAKTAMEHYQQKSANEDVMNTSIDQAKSLNGNEAVTNPNLPNLPTSPDTPAVASAATSGGIVNNPFSPSGACTTARTSGNASTYIECAAHADPTLPGFVKTQAFQNDFQKVSGFGLPQFFAQQNKPSQSIPASLGGALSEGDALKAGQTLASLEERILNSNSVDSSAIYAGGAGGGGHRHSAESDGGLSSVMSGLLSQFGAKNGDETLPAGTSVVAFSNAYRSPATVAENPGLSIFDRVSFRYHLVKGRLQ